MNRSTQQTTTTLERTGNITEVEINQQPKIWKETVQKFLSEAEAIEDFVQMAIADADQIIFTGAGTSSFLGHSLSAPFFSQFKVNCNSIATTDIVTFPEYYFNSSHCYFVISFARSGKSPESVAALELADRCAKKCYHLIITCNDSGPLAQYQSKNPVKVFALPKSTDDKGLAMTGSYSSMLLSGLLISLGNVSYHDRVKPQLDLSIKLTERFIRQDRQLIQSIAGKQFKRAVFLGSGTLYGTALEAALKLQELTSGKIICKSDTFLGFRHGPKAVIDEETLVVYFFSNVEYVRQYELDLIKGMEKGGNAVCHFGVSEYPVRSQKLDYQINLFEEGEHLDTSFLALNFIVPCQMLGFLKSLNFGLNPDAPSTNGAITRVVEGVTIYPFTNH